MTITWQDFLDINASRYLEAKQWRDAGLSWPDVLATWHKGDDLLWAAEQMGLIDHEQACKIACACVERNARLAPDVSAVTDAIWRGDAVAAWHEIIEVGDEIAGANKARYAAERLLSGDYANVLHHAVQARVFDARSAWAEAVRNEDSPAVIRELEAAIQRVEAEEHLAQAYFVRWLLGGLA